MLSEQAETAEEVSFLSYDRIHDEISIRDVYQVVGIVEITAIHHRVKGGIIAK